MKLKKSDLKIFDFMLRNLFEEYQHLPKYPDRRTVHDGAASSVASWNTAC